ncbi:MAG TPA: hypothetical protein VGL11_09835 [Candidatus Binatia bacterium]|jgi:Tfp pilus assembly PilM family ATPase
MAFGTSGVLGIEIGSSQIRMVRGTLLGETLRILDFAVDEILIPNLDDSSRQIDAIVERKQFRSLPAALTLSGPGVVHRHLDLPHMPPNELALVVQREITSATGAGLDDTVFSWETIEGSDSNLKQVRVLVAIAPKLQIDAAQQLLARCRLKPALFTTAPLALLRALKFAHSGNKKSQVALYLGGQQGYLLGIKNGAWNFYREFSSQASEGPGDSLSYRTLLEEAVTEAARAVAYYRQRHREGEEVNFFLSGEKRLEELKARLEKETGIKAEIVKPGGSLDVRLLGQHAKLFGEFFPSFLIPLGLSVAAHLPQGINLVPKSVARMVGRPSVANINWSFVQRPVVALGLLVVLLAGYLALTGMERRYEALRRERSALYAQWLPAIQAAEETHALRDSEQLLAQSLGASRVVELKWVGLFRSLSRLTEMDTLFQSLALYKDAAGKWIITLKGEVASPDPFTAQTVFNRFYQGLKRLPYLQQIELLPLNVTTVKERIEKPAAKAPAKATPDGANQNPPEVLEIKKTKVEFEVRGEAKET